MLFENQRHCTRLPRNFGALHDQLFKDADFIFQQDLAPAHTAKSTKSWLNDHGVGVLDWPANSPDLNPIENLWGIVKRKMRNKRPQNADELKATRRVSITDLRYFINVDKVLRNDGVSINQCYATKTYPFASRDKSWQRILVRFDRFFIYLFKGGVSVHLYRSSTESHFRNMRGEAGINKQ